MQGGFSLKEVFIIFIIALLIAVFGVISIYSSNYHKEGEPWQSIYKRQIFWVCLGTLLFFLMALSDYRRLWDWAYFLYLFVIGLLLLVFLLGAIRLGAQRWLHIAWFNLQPSEIAKPAIVILLARYFSKKTLFELSSSTAQSGFLRSFFIPFLFVLIPAGLIIEQPDLGSGMLIIFILVTMIFAAGVKLRYLLILAGIGLTSLPIFWHFLHSYQRDRIMVFLNPNIDPLGAGYTIIQAKIAIGSGGFFGKGWLSGTQSQLHFLPESHTDFIFSTFAEEWGFLGVGILLIFYFLILRLIIRAAEMVHDPFGKFLALGITLMVGIQILINLAMNMGFAPVVGIPLPLMSYGGSSIIATFFSLGIAASICRSSNYA